MYAQGIAARSDTTRSGVAVGKSPVRIADAPKSIPDALHNLLTSAETLREMISNRTPESAEMAAIEGRWRKNREARNGRL